MDDDGEDGDQLHPLQRPYFPEQDLPENDARSEEGDENPQRNNPSSLDRLTNSFRSLDTQSLDRLTNSFRSLDTQKIRQTIAIRSLDAQKAIAIRSLDAQKALEQFRPLDTQDANKSFSTLARKSSIKYLVVQEDAPLSADEAARKITAFFRKMKARRSISILATRAFGKVWSEKHGEYYYYNKASMRTYWHKPFILGAFDVEDDLTIAYRAARDLTPRSRVQQQLKIEQEMKKRKRIQKQRMARRVIPNHELGLPEAPVKVSANANDGTAAVWWTPGATNGANVVAYHVRRYRLDGEPMKLQSLEEGDQPHDQQNPKLGDQWHFKGSTKVPADMHKVMIKNLTNGKQYRFAVVAESYDKGIMGLGYVSEMSNIVMPEMRLPDGWRWIRDSESGRVYYYNFKTKQTSWKRPEEDPFYVKTEDFLCFNPHEIEQFKKQFQHFDYDHRGSVSPEELQSFVLSVGESLPQRKLNEILLENSIASTITFNQFCSLLRIIKENSRPRVEIFDMEAHLKTISTQARRLMVRHRIHVNRRMVQRDMKRMGAWSKFIDPVLEMSYYFNEVTQITTWVMPEEVKYYLPPDLRNLMDRTFSKEEQEKFKTEFNCYDLDSSGAIDEEELSIVLKVKFVKLTPPTPSLSYHLL
jgi:Ca2+-binding EF-hand superfamily protein